MNPQAVIDGAAREIERLEAQLAEAVGAVRDLVDNYAAHDQQAFEAAHARACRVLDGAGS